MRSLAAIGEVAAQTNADFQLRPSNPSMCVHDPQLTSGNSLVVTGSRHLQIERPLKRHDCCKLHDVNVTLPSSDSGRESAALSLPA
jgi:hypothetical protein